MIQSLDNHALTAERATPHLAVAGSDRWQPSLHRLALRFTVWWMKSHGDYFLVGPFTRYAKRAGLSDARLAEQFGLSVVELYWLMLCLTPQNPHELESLATYHRIDADQLATVLGCDRVVTVCTA
ncbi:MAG: hypothetical protein HY329_21310 [Chloroflexi bacterium]|nr:hypothetical protein [Chloroflexota bacterium]